MSGEENKEMQMPDFGKMIGEMMGEKELSRKEYIFMRIKYWFGILVNVLVKMMIGIAIIPLSSGISKKIFIVVFILWIGRPLFDKIFDFLGKMDLIKKIKRMKNE